jgi:hypothetical protein
MVCASGEALLQQLVEIAIPVCQKAERLVPRRGAGRKPEIPDWALAVLIIVAVARRKTSKSSQYRYLKAREKEWIKRLHLPRFPARSTYFDRYRRAWQLLERAVELEGRLAIRQGRANPSVVAVDKTLIAARGPARHLFRRRKQRRGVDVEGGWGRSEHDGWVYGYGLETVVCTPRRGTVWPLLVSANPANRNESMTFRDKIPRLPPDTRYVLADRGYDADETCEMIEWKSDHRTGRRFLCPLILRANSRRTARRMWRRTRLRQQRRKHREARAEFLKSPRGQQLYARRLQKIEPFHSWLKELFDLTDRVWHRGLDYNRTQLIAAIFVYQLLLQLNRRYRHPNGCVKWILDAL